MFRPTNDYKINLKNKIRNLEKLSLAEKGINDKDEVIADYPVLRRSSSGGYYDTDFWEEGNFESLEQLKRELESQHKGRSYAIEYIPRRKQIYGECIKELFLEDLEREKIDPEYKEFKNKKKQENLIKLKQLKYLFKNKRFSEIKEKSNQWRVTNFSNKKQEQEISNIQLQELADNIGGKIINN